jgi:hypothetical protein
LVLPPCCGKPSNHNDGRDQRPEDEAEEKGIGNAHAATVIAGA